MKQKKEGKSIKRVIKWAGIIAISVFFLIVFSIPVMNEYSAWSIEQKLCDTPLPKKTKLVDSVSATGKLVGNGNGMQYFGGILIESDLELQELEEYYSNFREDEWEYIVEIQNGEAIQVLEHKNLSFEKNIEGEKYYIVYSWGDNVNPLSDWDLRGH